MLFAGRRRASTSTLVSPMSTQDFVHPEETKRSSIIPRPRIRVHTPPITCLDDASHGMSKLRDISMPPDMTKSRHDAVLHIAVDILRTPDMLPPHVKPVRRVKRFTHQQSHHPFLRSDAPFPCHKQQSHNALLTFSLRLHPLRTSKYRAT